MVPTSPDEEFAARPNAPGDASGRVRRPVSAIKMLGGPSGLSPVQTNQRPGTSAVLTHSAPAPLAEQLPKRDNQNPLSDRQSS